MTANVVITGANRGIGLALSAAYNASGAHVIGLCRRASDALSQLGITVVEGVDVTRADTLADLPTRLGTDRIDVLINNAGVLYPDRLDNLDAAAIQRIRDQFEINTLGPLNVTLALKPMLAEGSKLIIITSRMGSLADNTSGGQYGYRASKAAVNMVGRSLSFDLAQHGVIVTLVHPGYVRTDMTGGNGMIDTDEAAGNIKQVVDRLGPSDTGAFFHANGDALPW